MTEAAKDLPTTFHEWIANAVDADGFFPHGLVIAEDGTMTVIAFDVPPDQIYQLMLAQWEQDPRLREAIFGLDRFTKPGQGTTLGDVVTGWHFIREGARPFIVEYQHEPRVVKPLEWANDWWNAVLTRELLEHMRQRFGITSPGASC
ncbi:hypothetical protein [Sphingomonas sp. BK235]|uniref:hypothetical protein n=1 Tax=Sphingomonas sp. BK235 TaxID=2512131 RepID=UPI00104D3CF7|nr:hypothetical protein [Sphingomonas sp. BK235]TCP30727.1 hypothetical protein EV292_11284 [Sphingomonas sp. BK235]